MEPLILKVELNVFNHQDLTNYKNNPRKISNILFNCRGSVLAASFSCT
jgi:hypothetical protein